MSDDDRTKLLEELPAAATRQMLALLNENERAIAARLLGYPEGSVGRLMTPHYIAVRPQWTVKEVLDYVRAHGQDTEVSAVQPRTARDRIDGQSLYRAQGHWRPANGDQCFPAVLLRGTLL